MLVVAKSHAFTQQLLSPLVTGTVLSSGEISDSDTAPAHKDLKSCSRRELKYHIVIITV